MSKRMSSKSKKGATPIILPQAFAPTKRGQGTGSLSGRQTEHIQELIDLLKKNSLTELELEHEGLRIRVRYEIGGKTITTPVANQGTSGSSSAAHPPAVA